MTVFAPDTDIDLKNMKNVKIFHDKCHEQTQQSDRINFTNKEFEINVMRAYIERCSVDERKNTSIWCWSVWLYTRVHFSHYDTLNSINDMVSKNSLETQHAKSNIG